jgi:hypothetical protein
MKEKTLSMPVYSIEFDKIYRVMDKRKSLGYSDRDLSFLLGYRPLYVRDVEDPLHTLRYTAKDTNYLLKIFDCELPEIMAGIIPEAFYQIDVEKITKDGNIAYRIYKEVFPGDQILLREFSNENKSDVDSEGYAKIEDFVQSLFDNGFFDEAKTALEVFMACRERLGSLVAPFDVANAVGNYTGRRKAPRLVQEKNESGRTVYKKEF